MPRLTRAQRQEQTRADLVNAAKARFLQHGYAATSLEDIADDAGYTKGAVYSNFGNKPNLCREVLEAIHHEKLGELALLAISESDVSARFEAVTAWFESTVGDVGWTMLELEFVVLSRNDKELTTMITELRNDAAASTVSLLRSIAADLGVTETQLAQSDIAGMLDNLANLLLSAGIGLGIQRAVDPSVPVLPATDAIKQLLNLLAALGATQS